MLEIRDSSYLGVKVAVGLIVLVCGTQHKFIVPNANSVTCLFIVMHRVPTLRRRNCVSGTFWEEGKLLVKQHAGLSGSCSYVVRQ